MNGSAEIVRLLLSAGASPDVVSGFEWTPLRAAAIHGHVEVVELLLERGADPNSGDKRDSIANEILGPTPASKSKVKILEALLASGARAQPREEPLIVGAVVHKSVPAILRILLAYGENPNQPRWDGTPILVLAARMDDPAGVDTLLQSGADVDATDTAGRSALMHAIERGHESVARILLASGADPHMRASDGTTALQIAQGLHRIRMQILLGAKEARPEAIEVARTTMQLAPRRYELRGDPELFDTWAGIIDHTIHHMTQDEFEVLVSNINEARTLAARLHHERGPASEPAAWHFLDVDASEVAVIHGCLLNLAYGPRMEMPEGLSSNIVADMFEDLARQLRG